MLILSLDTTASGGSCALCAEGGVLREHPGDRSVSHAARLPGELMGLLEAHGAVLSDVDAFAVSVGPGSFTGLRVGIATMQGLAFTSGKPLVGVSAFDALEYVSRTLRHSPRERDIPGVVYTATWIDAWRGEVFGALYEHGREKEPPTVEPPARLLARVVGRPTIFTGDGAALYADQIREQLGQAATFTDPVAPLLAGAIGLLAAPRLVAGDRPLPHAIRPLYVRRSDAELARDRR